MISDNTVEYTGSLDFEDQSGFAGGLSIDQFATASTRPATIRNTQISGNRVTR